MASTAEHTSPGNGRNTNTDTRRTLIFVGAAATCVAVTAAVEFLNRPQEIEEYGRVHEEFYPDFRDPTLASSLELLVFDAEEVRPIDFRVERLPNGLWSIPSHHNYPADAKDQLAKTAASVIGIKRGGMVTRWPTDHAQYGVVNPKQETLKVDEVEGVGKRLTLKGDGSVVLADYIIGKAVEEGESNQYYVRHPDESEVYITDLNISLSTKFSDWVNTDLLDVSRSDVIEVTVNDYSIDELQGVIRQRDTTTVHRDTSTDPWVLDGIDEENEEVDDDAMRDTIGAVTDMEIEGVRPKQEGLTPDLRLDTEALRSQIDLERLRSDLMSKGFLLMKERDAEQLALVAREGELSTATSDGLHYRLYFGRAFTGSQTELEIGMTSDDGVSDNSEVDKQDSEKGNTPDDNADEEADADNGDDGRPGRYIFIRVEFNEKYLGDHPVKPTEPQMPEELKAAEETETSDDSDGESAEGEDPETDSSDDTDADGSEDSETTDEEPQDPLADIRQEYEESKRDYESSLEDFEREQKDFEKQIEDGMKKAEGLNRRFADWYYVIPGADYEKLKLSRSDLVKEKEKEDSDPEESSSPTTESFKSDSSSDSASADAVEEEDSAPDPNDADATDTSSTDADSLDATVAAEEAGAPAQHDRFESSTTPEDTPSNADEDVGPK